MDRTAHGSHSYKIKADYCLCVVHSLPRNNLHYASSVGQSFQSKPTYYKFCFSSSATGELRNLRDEYLSATADGKKFMEQRFGKRVIQKAVEESYSTDWLNENCKCCPRCGTNIQVCSPASNRLWSVTPGSGLLFLHFVCCSSSRE